LHRKGYSAPLREYRGKNREKIAATKKEWQRKNREKIAATMREWRRKNPEKIKEYRGKNRSATVSAGRGQAVHESVRHQTDEVTKVS